MRCLRLLAWLSLSGAAVAQSGPPPIPDPLAGLGASLPSAFARMHVRMAELGRAKFPRDAWSSPAPVRALEAPHELPRLGMGWRLAARPFLGKPEPRALLGVGLALAQQPPFPQLWSRPRADASAKEAWRLLLDARTDAELPSPVLRGRLAEGWRLLSVATASLAQCARDSWAAPVPDAGGEAVARALGGRYASAWATGNDESGLLEAMRAGARIELESLGRHSLGALGLLQRAVSELQAAGREDLPPICRAPGIAGDLRFFCETPMGAVAIGGPGDTFYDRELFLVIDLGGDDRYSKRVAGASRIWRRPVSIAIDLDGRDAYVGREVINQGAGLLGIGILLDLGADDDEYRGSELCQGAAVLGLGLLYDDGGDDSYRATRTAQAAASFGFALLGDAAGADVYELRSGGQAFAGVRGHAALVDAGGDDVYVCRGEQRRNSALPETAGASFAQGVAVGDRVRGASGGVALLLDGGGSDRYDAGSFAQGCGFWLALGALIDESGDDRYAGRQYGQGAGVHLAAGLLWDLAGADEYLLGGGVGQGAGHDFAIGVLLDGAGDDRYAGAWLSQGAATGNGIGLLLEQAGDDDYYGRGPQPESGGSILGLQGYAEPHRGYGSIALLLDVAGEDRLQTRPSGAAAWETSWHGLAWDVGHPDAEGPVARRIAPVRASRGPGIPAGPAPTRLPAPNAVNFAALFGKARSGDELARRTLCALGQPALRWALAEHSADPSSETRNVLAVLVRALGATATADLRPLLSDESSLRRRNACLLLGHGGDRETALALRTVLEEDEVGYVRRAAARALGRLGIESSLPSFDRLLRSEDAADRRAAAEALGGIPGASAVHRLADLLGDASYEVRDPARESLRGREKEALELAIAELRRGKNPALREWLRLLRDWRPKTAREALRSLRSHTDSNVVREAQELLQLLGTGSADESKPGEKR